MKSLANGIAAVVTVVAPLAGAWIEIPNTLHAYNTELSLPSRERGLKFLNAPFGYKQLRSLPSRERGLKSIEVEGADWVDKVAPLAGAWIEIDYQKYLQTSRGSLPSRERGLKSGSSVG